MSNELNIHQLVRNQALRHKLSYFVPLHILDGLKRYQKPHYKTIQKIAEPYKKISSDDRSIDEIEIWLGEPIKQ